MTNVSVYMCRADYTPKASFAMINSLAKEEKLPNMAMVLNGVDMSKRKYSYYYGYASMASMVDMGDMVAILMVVMVTTEIIATAIMEIKMTILVKR